jgi:hypothetical protein
MDTDRAPVAEIEEVVAGRDPGVPRMPRRPGRRRAPSSAVLSAIVLIGIGSAIVTVGLLGPRPAPLDDAPPATEPLPTPAPRLDAVVPAPTAPVPLVRRSGEPLADPHVLVEGRWMNLETGSPAETAPDACARHRVLVLGSGRIVCVTADVTRTPGSRLALFDLAVATVGAVRVDPDAPPPGAAPAGVPEPQALGTLLGRRDVVIGDPVAIAVAPGPGPDDLVLAWAAVGGSGYEVALEAFRLGETGGQARRLGEWAVGRAPSAGRDAIDRLGNLSVAVDASSLRALVGWTEAGPGTADPVRRLAVVDLADAAPAAALPVAATRSLTPGPTDEPPGSRAPCGGPFGEGFGAAGTVYVVCAGATAEIRVLEAGGGPGTSPGRIVGSAPLEPGGTMAGTAWLTGNGIVAWDAVLYRWSPEAGTLWRVDLAGTGAGREPRTSPLALIPRRGAIETGAEGDAARTDASPRPVLALDPARGRLYALDAPVPRTDGRAVVHVIDAESWRYLWSFPLADRSTRAIALSPDGRLLYASTEPREVGVVSRDDGSPAPEVGRVPLAVGVAVLDARTGIELAYAGRLRVGAGAPLQGVVIR